MARNWYKLDNAAKIFPTVKSPKDPNTFRLAAVFKEDINVSILKDALEAALKRYPMFKVRLKRGVFWYYFERNNRPLVIHEQESKLFQSLISLRNNNDYMFALMYSKNRISIEIFHALTDGNGGIEFFKTICYEYLLLAGKEIENTGEILTGAPLLSEAVDSFNKNYQKENKVYGKEQRAYTIKGTFYRDYYTGMIHLLIKLDKLKEVASKYNVTITKYIGAHILYGIYLTEFKDKFRKTDNVVLFIPVNIRKYFDSASMRNFVLFVRASLHCNRELTFQDCLDCMNKTFEEELNKEQLLARLSQNVRFERIKVIRILPLFLKAIGMKIGYRKLGYNLNTISFSNLGPIAVPKEMEKYIERFEFAICPSGATPYNCAALSYQNEFIFTFASRVEERNLLKAMVHNLSLDGLEVQIEHNDLEVDQE